MMVNEIGQLQKNYKTLAARVGRLESQPEHKPHYEEMAAVSQITESTFGCTPMLKATTDPEDGASCIRVVVQFQGSDEEYLSKSSEWHRRVATEIHSESAFALSPIFE